MTNVTNGARMAAIAAALAASSFAFAADAPNGATGMAIAATDSIHCYGINACKGLNDCKTAANACKGQSTCKGQGFKGAKAADCLAKGGVIGDIK